MFPLTSLLTGTDCCTIGEPAGLAARRHGFKQRQRQLPLTALLKSTDCGIVAGAVGHHGRGHGLKTEPGHAAILRPSRKHWLLHCSWWHHDAICHDTSLQTNLRLVARHYVCRRHWSSHCTPRVFGQTASSSIMLKEFSACCQELGSPGTDDCGVAKDIMADFSRHGIKQAQSILPLTLLYTNTHGRIVADSIWLNFSTLHCTEDAQCLLPLTSLPKSADDSVVADHILTDTSFWHSFK